jgi:hypothetical protein
MSATLWQIPDCRIPRRIALGAHRFSRQTPRTMTRDEVLQLELRQLRRRLIARCIYNEREGLDLVALRFGLKIDKPSATAPWKVWHPAREESAFTSVDLTEAVIRAAAVMMDDELPPVSVGSPQQN